MKRKGERRTGYFLGTAFYPCVVGKSRKVKTTPLLTSKFRKSSDTYHVGALESRSRAVWPGLAAWNLGLTCSTSQSGIARVVLAVGYSIRRHLRIRLVRVWALQRSRVLLVEPHLSHVLPSVLGPSVFLIFHRYFTFIIECKN